MCETRFWVISDSLHKDQRNFTEGKENEQERETARLTCV